MSKNIFNDSINLGPILNNLSNQIVSNESVLTLLPNNQVLNIPISTFGKALLDSTSLADLRSQILENTEEAIRLLDDGNSEINFYTSGTGASQLRMQITNSNTFVKNVLNSSVIKTAAVRSDQNDNSTLIQSNDGSTNIRFVPQNATIAYLQNYGTLAFTKIGEGTPILAINHTDGQKQVYTNAKFNINVTAADNTFALYKCPGGEQVSIYSHSGLSEGMLLQKAASDDGIKLNMYHNSAYRNIYMNSANNSQFVVGQETPPTDSEKFIVASTTRFKDYVICDDIIKLNGPNNSGALYCKGNANPLNTNADEISLNYNIALNKATNVESAILPAERTAKIQMNQFAIQLQMSFNVNTLPSTLFEVNPINVVTFKNIVPNANNIIDLGIDDGSTLDRFRDCYLTQNLDITGTSSRVIMTDSSVADNTIRTSDVCGNTIVGIQSKTANSGRGFLRLSAGIETTQQINETYIDLYGANSTDTYQSIRHIVNNSEIFVIDTNTAEFKQNLITRTIYPEADISYDLGVANDNEWRNVYTENISVGGQFHHSDRRIKDNIIDLPNDKGLSFIQKIRPVQFTYKKSTQKRKHWGFIAQEIREVVGSDNYSIWGEQKTEFKKQHIAPSEFLGPIVKSIQELYELLTNTENKPIIIKEQQQGVQEHKCDNYELLNQLNSYEVQLLENENKLNKMDKFLEQIIEDKEKLEVNNKLQDLRIIELENKVKELNDKKEDTELMTEDDGDTMFDIMNKRLIELENRLIKTEKKNAKLVSTINKMLKDK
jgi:hypothetical protein